MSKQTIPPHIMKALKTVTAKRPRTVIDHIIQHGHITTEELKMRYGYNHPPRAARDVREQGIPLVTFKVRDSTGRSIGAYRFGDWEDFRNDKLRGRYAFTKKFKTDLIEHYGERCRICGADFKGRYLQIDHRIPYQVAGDSSIEKRNVEDYILLCSSCNRAKSWSCEHCANWKKDLDKEVCICCYWSSPKAHKHVALRDIRRLDLVWQNGDVTQYEALKAESEKHQVALPDFVKSVLDRHLKQ